MLMKNCTSIARLLMSGVTGLCCIAGYIAVESFRACGRDAIPDTTEDQAGFDESPVQTGLKFEATTIDFGTVFEGTRVTSAIKMNNGGAAPIKVVDVSASCGCTTVESEPSFVLLPGQQRSVAVQLDTANNTGPIEKRVTVFACEGKQRLKFPITMRAVSLPLVRIDCRILDFGMVKDGVTRQRSLAVSLMHEHEEYTPVYVASSPKGITATVRETEPARGEARCWTVDVAVAGSDIPPESVDGDLVLMTPSTVESVVRIPVRAQQYSFVSCRPARLNLGAIRSDTSGLVDLQCLPGHQFKVESVAVPGLEGVTATFDESSKQVRLWVTTESCTQGFLKGNLKIKYRCDDDRQQLLTVPVTGYRMALAP